ncbi:MAG: hypothetical protein NTY48_00675, partial [Candidatus Diapherotrites archaeon]|nr:hypothetical protein [Candidatus Diapherotrites archaeon]
FFLILISYFLEAGLNFVLLTNFEARLLTIPELSIAYLIHLIGFYGQIVFMLAGLIFILYTAAGLKKQEMLAIMLLLGVLPIFFVDDSLIFFYVISSICFLFVAMHFVRNYLAHKSKFSIAPAISFVLLLVANILLLSNLDLGSLTSDRIFYVLAHLLCFIAYLIMLVNFYMVLKK